MNDRNQGATAQSHFTSAQALHRQGRLQDAEQLYRAAIALDAGLYDAKESLGVLCMQQGNSSEALDWLGQAAAQCPQNAVFQDNLAAALLQAGRPEEAVAAYERSVAAAPAAIESRVKLGNLLLKQGRRGRAMAVFKEAVGLDPHLRAVCRDTSQILAGEARNEAVLENCRHILSRYPKYAPAHYSMACALLNLGQITEARRASERALVIDPTVPTYYHVLIHTGDPKRNTNAVSTMEQLAQHEASLDELDRATLHFLLAKAYDDQNRTDEAFVHLDKANAFKRGLIAYNEAREIGRMQAIAAAFTPERVRALGVSDCDSALPVFVVGMPRSGTTLIEQILASHPAVYGAGELTYLPDLVREGFADFPAGFDAATPQQLQHLGEAYAAKLAVIAPWAQRIVDKLPTNFLHVGLIHLALPGARIIHIRRDPLDTCFSCYATTFAGEVGYAYDLAELGRYYRAYDELMAHWRAVLPDGTMLEVQYEELVADLHEVARRIVDYCALPWDERCVEFHKTRRAVDTASLVQVRQPIYRKSVGRAQVYAAYLRPLCEALGLV